MRHACIVLALHPHAGRLQLVSECLPLTPQRVCRRRQAHRTGEDQGSGRQQADDAIDFADGATEQSKAPDWDAARGSKGVLTVLSCQNERRWQAGDIVSQVGTEQVHEFRLHSLW